MKLLWKIWWAIVFTIIIGGTAIIANAQISGGGISSATIWKFVTSGVRYITPVNSSDGLRIPQLGSTGNPCISIADTNGTFATTTCGSGGGTTLATTTVQTMSLQGLQGGNYNIWSSGFYNASSSQFTNATSTTFYNTGNTYLATASGRVGIGTITPASTLHVAYDASSTASTNYALQLGTVPLTSASVSGTGIGYNALSSFTGNLVDFQLGGSSKFKVTSAGSTFIPSGSLLGAGATSADGGFGIASNNGVELGVAAGKAFIATTAGSKFGQICVIADAVWGLGQTASSPTTCGAAQAVLVWTGAGLVGIGTATPASALHVDYDASSTASTKLSVQLGDKPLTSPPANGTYLGLNAPSSFGGHYLDFQNAGVDELLFRLSPGLIPQLQVGDGVNGGRIYLGPINLTNSSGTWIGSGGSGITLDLTTLANPGQITFNVLNGNINLGAFSSTLSTQTLLVTAVGGQAAVLKVASSSGTSILTVLGIGTVGINSSTPVTDFQVNSTTTNATTTLGIGSPTQPSCQIYYSPNGTKYYTIMSNAGVLTTSTTACKPNQ